MSIPTGLQPKRVWRRETSFSTFQTIRCIRRLMSTTRSVERKKAASAISSCALERGTAAFNSWRYPFPLNGQRFGAASRVGSVRSNSLHHRILRRPLLSAPLSAGLLRCPVAHASSEVRECSPQRFNSVRLQKACLAGRAADLRRPDAAAHNPSSVDCRRTARRGKRGCTARWSPRSYWPGVDASNS